ncbi:hypothetical protein GGI43DRAFT_7090 [Trichoderma evansii]
MFQPSFARSPTSSAVHLAADCWSRQRRVVLWRVPSAGGASFTADEIPRPSFAPLDFMVAPIWNASPSPPRPYRTRLGRLCSCEADSPCRSAQSRNQESDLVALSLVEPKVRTAILSRLSPQHHVFGARKGGQAGWLHFLFFFWCLMCVHGHGGGTIGFRYRSRYNRSHRRAVRIASTCQVEHVLLYR